MSFLKKNSIQFALWALLGICAVVLLGAAISTHRSSTVNDLKINIDYDSGLFFIKENEIQNKINALMEDSLQNITLRELPVAEIEAVLEENPFIKNAEVYSNIAGNLIVKVQQRNPVLRVINKQGVSFYIDDNAQTMPLSPNFTARVPVATGNIDLKIEQNDTLQQMKQKQLFDLIAFIRSEPFWNAQTEQIYVNENNDFELIPKLEDHVFLLGSTENLEAKFRRMNIFYKEVLKNQKSDQFKIINVKFNNQIICSKN
ncbi:MAG: hypothetical protein WD048_15725 [Chitinophagales bacterium]